MFYNIKVQGLKVTVENTQENIQAFRALRTALNTLFGPDAEGQINKLRAYQVIEETVSRDGDEVTIND